MHGYIILYLKLCQIEISLICKINFSVNYRKKKTFITTKVFG